MVDGRCLHPDVTELESSPLSLARVAATPAGAELWRCSICAAWLVRVPGGDLLDASSPAGADAFLRSFAAWIQAEAARRGVTLDDVRMAVIGAPPVPPRVVVRPPPPAPARKRASAVASFLVGMHVLDVRTVTENDLEELARVVSEDGPWSLPSLLASLPDEALVRRRVVAPSRALGTVEPWDVADLANEEIGEAATFVLVPAGDAGDLLPVEKHKLRVLATWESLRGEDRRRLARLAMRSAA